MELCEILREIGYRKNPIKENRIHDHCIAKIFKLEISCCEDENMIWIAESICYIFM
jgi:hypothetical protein